MPSAGSRSDEIGQLLAAVDALERAQSKLREGPTPPTVPASQEAEPPVPTGTPLPAVSLPPPPGIDIESPDRLLASLDALDDMVQNAKHVPLTDERRINAERFYELIEQARAEVPNAIKLARWVLREQASSS